MCVCMYEVCSEKRPRQAYISNPETEHRAHDHREVRELAHAMSSVSREGKERTVDKWNPYRSDRTYDDWRWG